jgi:hypothetical protein
MGAVDRAPRSLGGGGTVIMIQVALGFDPSIPGSGFDRSQSGRKGSDPSGPGQKAFQSVLYAGNTDLLNVLDHLDHLDQINSRAVKTCSKRDPGDPGEGLLSDLLDLVRIRSVSMSKPLVEQTKELGRGVFVAVRPCSDLLGPKEKVRVLFHNCTPGFSWSQSRPALPVLLGRRVRPRRIGEAVERGSSTERAVRTEQSPIWADI